MKKLGVKGYGKEPKSIPVGSETVIDMYPLDFEEFLWANEVDEPLISRIKECFQSIPKQLSKENKKFQYSVVKKGSTASKYEGSLQWIEDAGIITRCYNLSITELPLDGNAEKDTFKVWALSLKI